MTDWPTIDEVMRTLSFRAGYNTRLVMIASILLGVSGGIVGSFALLRKRSLMADALSHATLPGICLAFMAATAMGMSGKSLPVLLIGAAATGVIGVATITLLCRHTRLKEDAAIGIVLSVFFGIGVVLLSLVQHHPSGEQGGLARFIYGQTAAMSRSDTVLMGGIALAAVIAAVLLLKELAIVCFNDDYAGVTGQPVMVIDLLLMALVVMVTVAGIQAVGLILVIAILIIPAAAARFWTDRLRSMVIASAVIGGVSGYVGASASALFGDFPAGAVIVLAAGGVFCVSMTLAPRRGVIAAAHRRLAQRLRIAEDHLVKALYRREGSATTAALAAERGWSRWTARVVTQLARRRGLVERGFVENGDGRVGWRLTQAGRREGARVDRNHRLWEQYLVTHADVAASHVDWSADMVEHVLSPEIVEELERVVGAST